MTVLDWELGVESSREYWGMQGDGTVSWIQMKYRLTGLWACHTCLGSLQEGERGRAGLGRERERERKRCEREKKEVEMTRKDYSGGVVLSVSMFPVCLFASIYVFTYECVHVCMSICLSLHADTFDSCNWANCSSFPFFSFLVQALIGRYYLRFKFSLRCVRLAKFLAFRLLTN